MTDERIATCLHTWAVILPDENGKPVQNPVGVCGEAEQAVQRVPEALIEAPFGAVGVIHSVPLNIFISLRHAPGRSIRSATVDPETGEVV